MSLREKIEEVEKNRRRLEGEGRLAAIEKQHKLGKLTARERVVEKLLDKDTFIEVDLWALPDKTGFDIDKSEIPGDAVITGWGKVDGRSVCVYAQDFTTAAGTLTPVHGRKICKALQRAATMKIPCIQIADSGGQRMQESVVPTKPSNHNYGAIMSLNSIFSGVVPQIALVMGPCVAGPAYSPVLADFVIMTKGTGYMYISGPRIVKEVMFADTDNEELGGAIMHSKISGVCDLVGEDDADALQKARELLSFLPSNNNEKPPIIETGDDPNRQAEALLDIVPADITQGYNMHKIISLVVDGGYFFELKPTFAKNIIIGFARLNGQTVGIVANNPLLLGGALDIDACDKAARFIRFCDNFNIPLVFLVDCPGYLSDVEQERKGLIRHAAKLVFSVCEATVPKITVYIGKCYSSVQTALGNEQTGNDAILAWPMDQLAREKPEVIVNILYQKEIESAQDHEEVKRRRLMELNQTYGGFLYQPASRQLIEDIIDPRKTRPILINLLQAMSNKSPLRPWKKHENIPL